VEPERIVQIFGAEGGLKRDVVVETVTFEDHGQRTKVTAASRFDSKDTRDSMRQESVVGGASSRVTHLAERL
jgi:hypothetical protein